MKIAEVKKGAQKEKEEAAKAEAAKAKKSSGTVQAAKKKTPSSAPKSSSKTIAVSENKKKKTGAVTDEKAAEIPVEEKTEAPKEATVIEETHVLEEVPEKKGRLFMELIRFVVIGVVATAIDYVVSLLFAYLMSFTGWNEAGEMGKYGIWAVATAAGFLVSNVFNFLLSYIWVFDGGKKQKKRFWTFTLLGLIGLVLGIAIQLSGTAVADAAFGIDLGNLTAGFFDVLGSGDYIVIVAFTVVFVIKTAVTMVYNYVSRKLVLFKDPEKKEKKKDDQSSL